MSITKNDVHGGKEPLVSNSGNRIVVLEKTSMQRRFENWLNQTKSHQGELKKKPEII